MVKAATLMGKLDNIRNACLIASSDHDKDILMDSLMAAAGTAKEGPSDSRLTRSGALAQEVKSADQSSTNVSLCFEMTKQSLDSFKGPRDGETYLINLIQVPGHSDVPAQATDVLCMADGALIIAECGEGFKVHPEGLICHALRERIRPVLCLTNIDAYFWDSQDGEEFYQLLFSNIKETNDIMSRCGDKLLGDVQVYPQKGTVAFSSSLCGWGFTLSTFAKPYAHHLDIDEAQVMEWIWGDSFYDSETQEWTTMHTGTETCKRGFVKLCYEPIKDIFDICMCNDKSRLGSTLDHHGLVLKEKEALLDGEDLLRCVMKQWLPAGRTVLEMVILKLPSPAKAQQYRVENLYAGPLNDYYASSVRNCDPNGPLVIYIAKMIPSSKKARPFAFGRVFSGKVQVGMKVRVLGSNHVPGQKDYYVESLQSAEIFEGNKLESTKTVQCGNIVALIGLNKYIPQNATITKDNALLAFPLRAISVVLHHDHNLPDITLKAAYNSGMEDFHLPYLVHDDLFLHQREGIRWLWSMHCKDSGAILADDMGLGKTRQVCAFLCGLFHSGLVKRAVIVVPPSLIEPWGEELKDVGITNSKKFIDANTKKRLTQVVTEGGVLCTTYGMFNKVEEESALGQDGETWDYIFMDEGHRAKNRKSEIAKSLEKIECKHKIIITGTPIQNNLEEFHTLMNICKPLLLKDQNTFHVNYVLPINRGKHRDAEPHLKGRSVQLSSRLAKLTNPFILRRTKELLKTEGKLTSNKYEYTIWLEPSPCQVNYYKTLVTSNLLRVQGNALAATKIARDICRHPCLLMQNYSPEEPPNEKDSAVALKIKKSLFKKFPPHDLREGDCNISSKVDFILYLTNKLVIEEKHKQVLGSVIDKHKIIRMDGSTKRRDRNKMRMAFQCQESRKESPNSESSGSSVSTSSDLDLSKVCEPWIFLMTTKVGGVGLNLTAATRVIIADPAENPSDDNQAVDRAYRMGQMKDVIVYRLVTCAAIEEHTYREQILKIETSFGVLGEQPCMKSICEKEGLVLSLPPNGFKSCKTHRELVQIYGDKMEIELSDLRLHHKSVIAASNHSLLFSVKEDNEDDCYIPEVAPKKEKLKLKENKKMDEVKYIKIPPIAADRLLAYRKSRLKVMQRATTAAMDIVGLQMLISCGDPKEMKKAQKLVVDFVEQVESDIHEVIYIPKNKAGVIIGRDGHTITSIYNSSGAFVKIRDPDKGRKDLQGQKAIEISGNLQTIQAARGLILQKLKENRIPYTIEEDR